MGCIASLDVRDKIGLPIQKISNAHRSYKDFRSRMGDTMTSYRQFPKEVFKRRFMSDSIQDEFILTGWTSIISRMELMKRLPECSIEDSVEKTKAADELEGDENMKTVYEALNLAVSESDVRFLIYAYTINSVFYLTLNKKLSQLSASNNITEYLAGMLTANNDDNQTDEPENWPLCFTSVILKAVNDSDNVLNHFCGKIYRGITMTQHDLSLYKVGSLVVQKAFSSSSKQRSVAEKFASQMRAGRIAALLTFNLETLNTLCIDLEGLSAYENEEEVLILPLSIFMVTKIDRSRSSGFIEIELKALTSEETLGSVIPNMVNTIAPAGFIRSAVSSIDRFNLGQTMTRTLRKGYFNTDANDNDSGDGDNSGSEDMEDDQNDDEEENEYNH